jgi:hypothetical protein
MAPSAQAINIRILNDFPIHSVSAISSDPRILARVEQAVPSKEYRVIVEPKGTSEPVIAVLKIETDYPVENPQRIHCDCANQLDARNPACAPSAVRTGLHQTAIVCDSPERNDPLES